MHTSITAFYAHVLGYSTVLHLISNLMVTLSGLTDNKYPDTPHRQAVCSLSWYLSQVGLFTSPTYGL